jgi:hypothetical protein
LRLSYASAMRSRDVDRLIGVVPVRLVRRMTSPTGGPVRPPRPCPDPTSVEADTSRAKIENTGQMHVIFLDIDGVLNCKRTPNPRKLPYIVDPLLLKRFVRLVDRTAAKVVLSSTWRYDPAGLFSAKHWGVPFIDVLPDMPKRPRRDEILAWLKAHPDTHRFAVLDDEDDELDELPLFQPSAATGLTDEIVKGITIYLSGKTDRDMRCNRVKRFLQNMHAVFKGHEG